MSFQKNVKKVKVICKNKIEANLREKLILISQPASNLIPFSQKKPEGHSDS